VNWLERRFQRTKDFLKAHLKPAKIAKTISINDLDMEEKKLIKKGDVAIVIGHTKLRPGACSPYGIPCEWTYNNKVASYLKDIADVYHYGSYNAGYKSMVRSMANKLNKKSYKLVIELHYNAASPVANGTECFYYYTNKKGKSIAESYCKRFTELFGTKNRGAKAMVSKKQRGFWALYYPQATTILPEPFFGSNRSDCKKVKGKEKMYADMLRELIRESI
jgi:N-acetylmuramoyl-L-alanine amidase